MTRASSESQNDVGSFEPRARGSLRTAPGTAAEASFGGGGGWGGDPRSPRPLMWGLGAPRHHTIPCVQNPQSLWFWWQKRGRSEHHLRQNLHVWSPPTPIHLSSYEIRMTLASTRHPGGSLRRAIPPLGRLRAIHRPSLPLLSGVNDPEPIPPATPAASDPCSADDKTLLPTPPTPSRPPPGRTPARPFQFRPHRPPCRASRLQVAAVVVGVGVDRDGDWPSRDSRRA